jgi:hypothetical protein
VPNNQALQFSQRHITAHTTYPDDDDGETAGTEVFFLPISVWEGAPFKQRLFFLRAMDWTVPLRVRDIVGAADTGNARGGAEHLVGGSIRPCAERGAAL